VPTPGVPTPGFGPFRCRVCRPILVDEGDEVCEHEGVREREERIDVREPGPVTNVLEFSREVNKTVICSY